MKVQTSKSISVLCCLCVFSFVKSSSPEVTESHSKQVMNLLTVFLEPHYQWVYQIPEAFCPFHFHSAAVWNSLANSLCVSRAVFTGFWHQHRVEMLWFQKPVLFFLFGAGRGGKVTDGVRVGIPSLSNWESTIFPSRRFLHWLNFYVF